MKTLTIFILGALIALQTTEPKIHIADNSTGQKIDSCDCNLGKPLNADIILNIPEKAYSYDKISLNLLLGQKIIAFNEWTKIEFASTFPKKDGPTHKLKFLMADLFSKKYNSSDKSHLRKPGGGVLRSEDLCKMHLNDKTIDGAFAKRKDAHSLILDLTGHIITGQNKITNDDGSTTLEPNYGKETKLTTSTEILIIQSKKK